MRGSTLRVAAAHVGGTDMTVLGISGSLRKASYNSGLLRAVRKHLPESAKLELANIADLPVFNNDLTTDEPVSVTDFRKQLRRADCILFASPEHNYNVTAAMKNCLDWASKGPNEFNNKPCAVMGTGGGASAQLSMHALRQSGVFLNLRFINKPLVQVRLGDQPPHFDPDTGDLRPDSSWQPKLKDLADELLKWTLLLKGLDSKF